MYKTKLQELCHQFAWNLPAYATEKDGPDHNPRFTATVIVNGVSFESPKDQCRSSKEAQNHAAHIAYDHFTVHQSILFSHHNLPSPAVVPTSSGASTSKSKVGDRSSNMDIFQQRQNNIGQLSRIDGTALVGVDTNTSKGMLHLYKNRLQHYAQKQNLSLPVYSSVLDGPPHARRFSSKVTVDGVTYETQEYFSTLKEAEHAAAKVAFESLALNDIQEDEGLYKTLLQELAQKEGLLFPVYDTARTGPPHAPVFRSMVEVGDGTFQGQEAKTKKQAEMNAAKVAYNALVKRMLHLYKNRLQHYAQKQNLSLPVYSSVLDGPPHARCFSSKVTVDGVTYETQEYFSTLKEAEHAAAKVAFESLALNDIQEDEGLYKTLLQELAQKEGLLFPVYDTARTGPPHAPVFRSMVEVGDGTFQGQEAKTKKQAEMNAAKVAYNALVKRGQLDEPLQVLPASSECAVADVSELVVQQKTKLIIEELSLQNEEADTNAKRHRYSTAPKTYSLIRDHCPAAPSAASDLTDAVAESADSGTYAGTSIMSSEKIFIFPRNANMELPSGASVLPCSDEKWVATSLELNQNH